MYWHPLALGLLVFVVWVVGCGVGVVIGTQQDGESADRQAALETAGIVSETVVRRPTVTMVRATPTPTKASSTATSTRVPTATAKVEFPEAVIRWRKWFQVHNPNLLAMQEFITGVGEDRVIDESEHERLCFIYPQWEGQLRAMTDYLAEYEAVDLETVQANQAAFDAREEAVRQVQEVVAEIEPTCP